MSNLASCIYNGATLVPDVVASRCGSHVYGVTGAHLFAGWQAYTKPSLRAAISSRKLQTKSAKQPSGALASFEGVSLSCTRNTALLGTQRQKTPRQLAIWGIVKECRNVGLLLGDVDQHQPNSTFAMLGSKCRQCRPCGLIGESVKCSLVSQGQAFCCLQFSGHPQATLLLCTAAIACPEA